jgi:RNA recognition motif-containing protein
MSNFNDFKLFVGNMPGDVTPEEIRAAFAKFGDIVEVYIMGGNRSRSGQSSAFVKFTNMNACHEAIEEMHMKGKIRVGDVDALAVKFAKPTPVSSPRGDFTADTMIPSSFYLAPAGSVIGITSDDFTATPFITPTVTPSVTPAPTPRSSPSSQFRSISKLFVGGLPTYIDRDDLIAIFSPFGKVESVHLMNNNKSKSGQNCAFINYYSKAASRKAIDALNGKYKTDESIAAITVRFADGSGVTGDADETNRCNKRLRTTRTTDAKLLAQQAAKAILQNI